MSRFSDGDLERALDEALTGRRAVPDDWREAARAAFTWRNLDQELLALTYDSQLEAAAAVRGDEGGRTLEFSGGGLTLEVELTDRGIEGRVASGVVGGVVGGVVVEWADGRTASATPDGSGFFSVAATGSGTVRFAVRDGEARLVTEWIVV